MDSDTSTEENSSSECSTDSSDDDKLETTTVCGAHLQLPQGLCEHKEVFQEFFSAHTWNALSDANRQHLKQFLPTFPANDEDEKNITLQRLFNGEVFRFTSPLMDFHEQLKAGHFRPDIAKMRAVIKRTERKEAKLRYRSYRQKLRKEVIESREKLLNVVRNIPPGVVPRLERTQTTPTSTDPIAYSTKRRYFAELAAIRAKVDETGFSSDENYPEGPPVSLSRKQKRHLNSIKNAHSLSGEKVFVGTTAVKPTGLDLERQILPNYNPFFMSEDSYRNLLCQHKRRKLTRPDDPELNTSGITVSQIVQRTKLPYIKKLPPLPANTGKHHLDNKLVSKKKARKDSQMYNTASPELLNKTNPFFGHSSNSEFESDSDSLVDTVLNANFNKSKVRSKSNKLVQKPPVNKVKTEIIKTDPVEYFSMKENVVENSLHSPNAKTNAFSQYGKIAPATLSDLDGIDMMNLPIDLDDSNIDILELNNKPELMQETHANFLSLIRDIICSTNEHRMNMKTLEERLKSWQENPISPLNDWYSLSDNWVMLLQSAVNFLSGNFPEQPDDFVPYIEYKPQLEMYQWIGAGRDSDSLLSPLCQYWLERRNEMKASAQSKEKEDVNVDVADRSQTPPPPRCPTNWTVRKADPDEIQSFREQERKRYDNPHKAFTYRCNGYESVVGPLKGIYNPSVGNAKARGHTMLSADRPNFVTILSLVRDATARLPNGEGTRADICELLKSSQYISNTAPDNVLQSVVSGALDRMHTQFDPCVKYDPKRKIWIYLHRNRSEEDFERLHQQYQGMNKNMKKPTTKSKTPSKPKPKVEKKPIVKVTTSDPNQIPTTVTEKVKTIAKPKVSAATQPQVVSVCTSVTSTNGSVSTSKAPTSLLLANTPLNKPEASQNTLTVSVQQQEVTPSPAAPQPAQPSPIKRTPSKQNVKTLTPEEKEINEALQAIVQNRVGSPIAKQITNSKIGNNLVKIISPTQGKSLIIPSSNAHILKQPEQQRNSITKITQPQVVTQQFLQTLAMQAQQKQLGQQQTIQLIQKSNPAASQETTPVVIEQKKPSVTVQQQIIHSLSPQQLQNIKNVTLLRQGQQTVTPVTLTVTSTTQTETKTTQVPITVQATIQEVKPQQTTTLTPDQQQQILQTLKQKGVPIQTAVIGSQSQQHIILKQKATVAQLQKQLNVAPGTSLLGQSRITTDSLAKTNATTPQASVVAKLLTTNAAGQVISVESLLAHQKQYGSLPQGTTLRVSGAKGGQANIIQLTASTKPNPVTQLSVGSQNIITVTNQPKLVVASQTTTVTSTVTTTKPTSRTVTKTQTITKFPSKVAQQLINAKFITQTLDGQKIVQPKIIVGQQNQIKLASAKNIAISKAVPLTLNPNTNTIRMVNAANLNLTQIGGKPVLLAGKGGSLQNVQGQNVILQTQTNTSGPSLVLQNTAKGNITQQSSTSNISLISQPNSTQVVLAPQLKVQQTPQVVFSSNVKSTPVNISQQNVTQGQIVIGGHPVRVQTSNSTNTTQRVVLASQGQGGQIVAQQILLPAGFQGAAINIKALQGLKVIPIAQAQQGRGVQNRQVFARVINPANIRTAQPTPAPEIVAETSTPTTE